MMNLEVICSFSKHGCNWQGRFEEYLQHVENCDFAMSTCECCEEELQLSAHTLVFPKSRKECGSGYLEDYFGPQPPHRMTHFSAARVQIREMPSSIPPRPEGDIHTIIESMVSERLTRIQEELRRNSVAELRQREEEVAELKMTVKKLEKTVQIKTAKLEDRLSRSLIENSNYDGTMIWKIPQFSQRKADAENGKYTSIFSLPFYTGRYGYKMCLHLYIMGDGIGKGTHLSLFFVVMRGEFDNILQWPFTHKVTFKLINQAGTRDIVDTFQPDPMSSSFRKPKSESDMNIASGCPRFVSHTELERGGFLVDDMIFIKCSIDTSTIHHP
jgi:hypothetical protein